jgi:hypothetical protein
MKTIVIKVKDSLYDQVKSFLKILPRESVEVVDLTDFSHIDFVSDEEQKDIEKALADEETKTFSESKTLSF